MKYIFITDLHFQETSSVRTGDVLVDLSNKLHYVVDYTNKSGATLLIGGDIFHKPTSNDNVKSVLIRELIRLSNTPFAIPGNHDILFNNEKYLYKTSYNVLLSAGIIKDLTTIDYGDYVLTSRLPLIDRGKPQLCMFHGFLNIEDGLNTFRFQDIETDDPCIVLLGHDHTVYEPLQYRNTTILREGSFLRDSRLETSFRTPNMVEIDIDSSGLSYKLVPIQCRPADSIFREKEVKKDIIYDFNAIIDNLRGVSLQDVTFKDALLKVCPNDKLRIVEYIMNLL